MNNLLQFIDDNGINWKKRISEKPYCVNVKQDGIYIMLSYNQIDSDFYNPVVKECRGCILKETEEDLEWNIFPWIDGGRLIRVKYVPVCVPFYKFGNLGEGYSDKVDWATARIQEKVDGSIIKLWHSSNKWNVSTNGCLDAYSTDLQFPLDNIKSFGDLFNIAAKNQNLDYGKLDTENTYIFEVVSPYNRVVVPHQKTMIYHIGTRSNVDFMEKDIDIGIIHPKEFHFKSLEDCVEMSKTLPFSEEGYVVVDSSWHRVKIKSPAYLAVHRLKDNGNVSWPRILDLVRKNEQDEFLIYFPEYLEPFEKARIRYGMYKNTLSSIKDNCPVFHEAFDAVSGNSKDARKKYAEWAKGTECPDFCFKLFDSPDMGIEDYLDRIPTDRLVKTIGLA